MGPEELGRYRLRRVLGRGSIGEVWEAQDSELGRRVAVKILRAGDDDMALARMRFSREARAAAILRHPNLVVVHDAGEAAGTCFIIMELVEGRTFRALARAADVSVEDKIRWIRELAEALRAMHHAGIVHRDVKPVNVIVRADGSACLVDLGISKWKSPEAEPSLEIGDSDLHEGDLPEVDLEGGDVPDGEANGASAAQFPEHVPPEARLAGIYDERGDQYAWAVTAYELLIGAPPSSEAPLSVRPGISSRVAAAIEKARAPSPISRFERMDDLVDALEDDDAKPSSPPEKEPSDAPPPHSVKRASSRSASFARGVGGAVAIVAVFAVAVSVRRWATGGAKDAQMVPPAVASVARLPTGPSRKISIGSLEQRYRTSMSSPVEDQRAVVSAKKSAMEACVHQHPPQCPMSMVVVCQLQQDGTVPSCLSSAPGKCEKRELGLCLEHAVPMKLPGSEKRPAASDFALELVVD